MRKLLIAAVLMGTVAGIGNVEAAPVAMPLPTGAVASLAPASVDATAGTPTATVQTVQYRRRFYRRHYYRRHGRYYR